MAMEVSQGRRFDVQFTFTRTPLRLQHRALDNIDEDFWNKFWGPRVIGKPTVSSTDFACSGDVTLNQEQKMAVRLILSRPSQPIILHGPPGTGKTATIVEAILQVLIHQPSAKILACAPSNNAADLITSLLARKLNPQRLLRLNALQRSPKALDPPSIVDYCIQQRSPSGFTIPLLADLLEYQVIVSTCISSGYLVSMGVHRTHFTHFIIDEAGEALEPETLVPLQLAGEKGPTIVLAGDHKQLGPIVRSPLALEWKLDCSMMEHLLKVEAPVEIVELKRSYRAHPDLLWLYSTLFYDGKLVPAADPRITNALIRWQGLPNPKIPLVFIHSDKEEAREKDSPSWFNQAEIEVVFETVRSLITDQKMNVKAADIGIITPYRKQVDKLKRRLHYEDTQLSVPQYKDIKIGTVENFQGQERTVIIVSLVRSRSAHLQHDSKFKLGFCSNPKRMNVAISRAKALLIIVGNAKLFGENDVHWDKLLQGQAPVWTSGGGINSNSNGSGSNNNSTVVVEGEEFVNVDQEWRDPDV